MSAQLTKDLLAVLEAKGPDYKPRTRHLRPDGSAKYINRLIREPSPYLQQHAHNPVDWHPWGDEAFALAKALDRPVLLSIGYSTCHWCHVMEEESFEDEDIARYLNGNFIAIKVDREERPDVDSIYMTAVQAMGQGGGWPLNVWLTPDRKPFYGGTYFPPVDRQGRIGFGTVLRKIKEAYDGDRDRLLQSSDELVAHIRKASQPPAGTAQVPGDAVLEAAAAVYARTYDPVYGGLQVGRAGNKFPSSLPVRFLLRFHRRSGDASFLEMAINTLDKMAAGGMYDQAGGGFHRYSTDRRWLVPHFEKMLYDNALLASAYLEAFQATGAGRHADVVRHLLAYVARDMRAPQGGFYSATDADSIGPKGEREEGYFFTWTPEEVTALIGEPDAQLVSEYFGVRSGGNFEGRSILHVTRPLAEVASALGRDPVEAAAVIERARETLYTARKKRPLPQTDDKVLVAWNGLMISAFANAARVLGPDPQRSLDYLQIASEAAEFIWTQMRPEGRLLRSSQGGVAHLNAYLEDYAFYEAALIDLYMASQDRKWLQRAVELQTGLDAHYADQSGGYFMTADDHESLLTREKPGQDGATPSGNSIAVMNLLRLHQLTGKQEYIDGADATLRAFGQTLNASPIALSEMLLAVDFRSDAAKQIVIVSPKGQDASAFRSVLANSFLPNHVYVETEEGAPLAALAGDIPLVDAKIAIAGETTAYVCEDSNCDLPTSDPQVFGKQLARARALQGSAPGE